MYDVWYVVYDLRYDIERIVYHVISLKKKNIYDI